MKTILIEVSDEQFDALKDMSEGQGKSISDIVNIAIEQIIPAKISKDINQILEEIKPAAGIWSDRYDIGDTVEYVRNLRKGTAERLRRLGIWDNDQSN